MIIYRPIVDVERCRGGRGEICPGPKASSRRPCPGDVLDNISLTLTQLICLLFLCCL